jgi:hypothetical protein
LPRGEGAFIDFELFSTILSKERRFVKRRDVGLRRRGNGKLGVGWRRRRGFSERGKLRTYSGNKERKRKNCRERKKRERCGNIIYYHWG